MAIRLTPTPSHPEDFRTVFNGITVNTSKVNVCNAEYDEVIPEDLVNVTIGVFYDGTRNNRKNVNARKEYEKDDSDPTKDKEAAKHYNTWYTFKKSGSYDNEHSNISRMEPAYKKINTEKNIQLSLYIEGIGTENYEGDSTWGSAMGKGVTGVKGKVKKGCKKIAELLARNGVHNINILTIDTYGFSRGAAAARYFIHEIFQRKGANKEVNNGLGLYEYLGAKYTEDFGVLGEELAKNGISLRLGPIVRFVGLYDTVASFGLNHDSDTKELHLDAISKACFTFQLAAADEHRKNFRLTNIKSARKGLERFLPGVHSDIGGGYRHEKDEELTLDYGMSLKKMEDERQKLIAMGWYLPHQIEVNKFWGSLRAKRENISNRYSYIPMHVMAEYSEKKEVKYDISLITDSYAIVNENKSVKLTEVKERIDHYVYEKKGQLTFDSSEDKVMLKALRNQYFHFSAHYNNSILGVIAPMSPDRDNGVRTRQIQPG
ncbi:T6SS phospholipase effector Tle1-like catalytic domain-containing protein [Bizionia paragorgiae]|uniref:T6SS phospholipase effector Tle1-like catalytic domain-containing protein n=1 Tax=Bizionia paragorgiae TaxID=283786 RepID=UPI003A914062